MLNIPITQYHTNVEAPELRTPRYNVGSHAMVAVIKNGRKVDVVSEGSTFIAKTYQTSSSSALPLGRPYVFMSLRILS